MMAGKFDVELDGGWDKLVNALKPGAFERRLKRYVGVATAKNALVAEGAIKERIANGTGRYAANRPLTEAIKGSSRPLVDGGDLLKSITGRAEEWNFAVIGVLASRQVKGDDGKTDDILNIARILHNGFTIRVTNKMRRFFAVMARKHPGKWKPLSPRTKSIRVPARPFLRPVKLKSMVEKYKRNWDKAVQRAMSGKD